MGPAYIFNTVRPGRSSSARRRWVMDTRMNRMLYRGFYACTCRVYSGSGGGCSNGGCGSSGKCGGSCGGG